MPTNRRRSLVHEEGSRKLIVTAENDANDSPYGSWYFKTITIAYIAQDDAEGTASSQQIEIPFVLVEALRDAVDAIAGPRSLDVTGSISSG